MSSSAGPLFGPPIGLQNFTTPIYLTDGDKSSITRLKSSNNQGSNKSKKKFIIFLGGQKSFQLLTSCTWCYHLIKRFKGKEMIICEAAKMPVNQIPLLHPGQTTWFKEDVSIVSSFAPFLFLSLRRELTSACPNRAQQAKKEKNACTILLQTRVCFQTNKQT